jgi:hypothetical protein
MIHILIQFVRKLLDGWFSAKYGTPNPTEAVIQIMMAYGMSCPIKILKLLPKCQARMAASDSHLTVRPRLVFKRLMTIRCTHRLATRYLHVTAEI